MNRENYMKDMIDKGLHVGSIVRQHFGRGQMSNWCYQVKEITSERVVLGLVIDKIAIEQLKYKSITKKDIIIFIDKCGSFPRYIETQS